MRIGVRIIKETPHLRRVEACILENRFVEEIGIEGGLCVPIGQVAMQTEDARWLFSLLPSVAELTGLSPSFSCPVNKSGG